MNFALLRYCFVLFTILLFFTSCLGTAYRYVRTNEDLKRYVTQLPYSEVVLPKNTDKNSPCTDFNNYAPDSLHPEYTPVRWVRVNAHFVNSSDSSRNYQGEEAVRFVETMLQHANKKLNENEQMRLPLGNNTPVLQPRFQWRLTGLPNDPADKGVYFHYDDDLYWVNKKGPGSFHSRNVCNKYSVWGDSIINVFFVEHHPDSIKSPTYRATGNGIGYATCVKMIGAFYAYQNNLANNLENAFEINADGFANLFNHELGHSLGLSHTWNVNDGCDDTPLNNNCWNINEGKNCETEVSNNIMDYNAFSNALSPCQIAKVQYNMAQPKLKQSIVVSPVWCEYDPEATLYINTGDTITWQCNKDFNGDIVVKSGAQLTLRCHISMPPGSKIVVQRGAKLILDGCHIEQRCPNPRPWQGIELQRKCLKPKPRLIVQNGATMVIAN